VDLSCAPCPGPRKSHALRAQHAADPSPLKAGRYSARCVARIVSCACSWFRLSSASMIVDDKDTEKKHHTRASTSAPPELPPPEYDPVAINESLESFTDADARSILDLPPPYEAPHAPLSLPFCLPQESDSGVSVFVRGYSDALATSGIQVDAWLRFVDAVNVSMVRSSSLNVVQELMSTRLPVGEPVFARCRLSQLGVRRLSHTQLPHGARASRRKLRLLRSARACCTHLHNLRAQGTRPARRGGEAEG
jgi:hypothetical protein